MPSTSWKGLTVEFHADQIWLFLGYLVLMCGALAVGLFYLNKLEILKPVKAVLTILLYAVLVLLTLQFGLPLIGIDVFALLG